MQTTRQQGGGEVWKIAWKPNKTVQNANKAVENLRDSGLCDKAKAFAAEVSALRLTEAVLSLSWGHSAICKRRVPLFACIFNQRAFRNVMS